MIELAIFIKEQKRRKSLPDRKELKILPLFMGFSVEEFRNTERQTCWQNKWNEIRVGDDRIDVSVWKEALKVLGGTNGLEYCRYKNEEEYIDSIMSAIFKLVTPDLKWEDSYMKGKSKFHQVLSGNLCFLRCDCKRLSYLPNCPSKITLQSLVFVIKGSRFVLVTLGILGIP